MGTFATSTPSPSATQRGKHRSTVGTRVQGDRHSGHSKSGIQMAPSIRVDRAVRLRSVRKVALRHAGAPHIRVVK